MEHRERGSNRQPLSEGDSAPSRVPCLPGTGSLSLLQMGSPPPGQPLAQLRQPRVLLCVALRRCPCACSQARVVPASFVIARGLVCMDTCPHASVRRLTGGRRAVFSPVLRGFLSSAPTAAPSLGAVVTPVLARVGPPTLPQLCPPGCGLCGVVWTAAAARKAAPESCTRLHPLGSNPTVPDQIGC